MYDTCDNPEWVILCEWHINKKIWDLCFPFVIVDSNVGGKFAPLTRQISFRSHVIVK